MDRPRPESLHPYSERNGVGVEQDIQTLLREPEQPLNPEERRQAYEFAHDLFVGKHGDIECATDRDLDAIYKADMDEQTFYPGYFHTHKGREELAGLGIAPDLDDHELAVQLSNIEQVTALADKPTREEIAANSWKWYKRTLADRLLAGEHEQIEFVNEQSITVNYDPEKLLTKLEDLQSYRAFYREIYRAQRQELPAAHQTLLELYAGRINSLIADSYIDALNLASQLDRDESDRNVELAERLGRIVPVVARLHKSERHDRAEQIDDFVRRLDLVRNGAEWGQLEDDHFKATPISAEMYRMVSVMAERQEEQPESGREEQVLSPEVVEVLDATVWNANQLKTFNEAVLASWGQLSEYAADWREVAKREGFAPDGKYQVVVSPKADSLKVDSSKRVLLVPDSFERTLTAVSPGGALPISAHELTHTWQSIFDYELGENIPLARIKGRRYVTVREAGGVYQERVVQRVYFGRERPTNLHYYHALQAKLAGGSKTEVIRTFYESFVAGRELDEKGWADARRDSVDRALRLYRNNGHNSQPLDYVEQGLIVEELEKLSQAEVMAFLIAAGSFTTRDTAALRKADLFEMPHNLDFDPPRDVMHIFMRDFLPGILARAN